MVVIIFYILLTPCLGTLMMNIDTSNLVMTIDTSEVQNCYVIFLNAVYRFSHSAGNTFYYINQDLKKFLKYTLCGNGFLMTIVNFPKITSSEQMSTSFNRSIKSKSVQNVAIKNTTIQDSDDHLQEKIKPLSVISQQTQLSEEINQEATISNEYDDYDEFNEKAITKIFSLMNIGNMDVLLQQLNIDELSIYPIQHSFSQFCKNKFRTTDIKELLYKKLCNLSSNNEHQDIFKQIFNKFNNVDNHKSDLKQMQNNEYAKILTLNHNNSNVNFYFTQNNLAQIYKKIELNNREFNQVLTKNDFARKTKESGIKKFKGQKLESYELKLLNSGYRIYFDINGCMLRIEKK